ncbi:hypothetical protein ACJJTC_003350 [Scirpophaga incertulas]
MPREEKDSDSHCDDASIRLQLALSTRDMIYARLQTIFDLIEKSASRCKTCNNKHHTLLHFNRKQSNSTQLSSGIDSSVSYSNPSPTASSFQVLNDSTQPLLSHAQPAPAQLPLSLAQSQPSVSFAHAQASRPQPVRPKRYHSSRSTM